MEQSPPKPGPPSGSPADQRAAERETRLAAALRTNLRRRKAQSRARQDTADEDVGAAAPGGDSSPNGTDDRGGT